MHADEKLAIRVATWCVRRVLPCNELLHPARLYTG